VTATTNGAANGKGPPASIEASELWALITQLPRPVRVVDFPGKDPNGSPVGQVAIWPLTQEELMICAAQASRVAKELMGAVTTTDPQLAYEKVFQDACASEILARACRDVKDEANGYKRAAFPAPREIRRRLTQDQIQILARAYLRVEAELGPVVATLSPEEEEAWIRRLAQAGNVFPIVSLSREALELLTLSLACRLRSSLTDTSSHGSPPDASLESEKGSNSSEASSEPTAAEAKAPEFVDEFAQADNAPKLSD